jgi:hypothetical protein
MPQPHPFCWWIFDPYPLLCVFVHNHTSMHAHSFVWDIFLKPKVWFERGPHVRFVGIGWAFCGVQSCVCKGKAFSGGRVPLKYPVDFFAGIWLKMGGLIWTSVGPALPCKKHSSTFWYTDALHMSWSVTPLGCVCGTIHELCCLQMIFMTTWSARAKVIAIDLFNFLLQIDPKMSSTLYHWGHVSAFHYKYTKMSINMPFWYLHWIFTTETNRVCQQNKSIFPFSLFIHNLENSERDCYAMVFLKLLGKYSLTGIYNSHLQLWNIKHNCFCQRKQT